MRKTIASFLLFCLLSPQASAFEDHFIFGLRLQENRAELVPQIEETFDVRVPVVSIIYDDFNELEAVRLGTTFSSLGSDRVYHISINPFGYTLKQILADPDHMGWERKYRGLFRLIRKYDAKVIFRSLHEMNGGWYSWSSDPENFPVFWKLIWKWSREEGLDRSNILFDFSVNSQDLPAADPGNIYQGAPVITCNQKKKRQIGCHTFEDYYPGDEYVDLLGVTIYNWGEGARMEDWATWRDPMTVIDEPGYDTFTRMKRMGKPIFIDEAGSTSIRLKGPYDAGRLPAIYDLNHTPASDAFATGTVCKNDWIARLPGIYGDPQVLGGAYFNADVTDGLKDRSQIGELDWMAIDPERRFAYPAIVSLLNDPRNLEFPTFSFEVSEKTLKSKDWLTKEEIGRLHPVISPMVDFKEGEMVMDGRYQGANPSEKYHLFLEKKLAKDPVLCRYVAASFPKIGCPTDWGSDLDARKTGFAMIRRLTAKSGLSDPIALREKIAKLIPTIASRAAETKDGKKGAFYRAIASYMQKYRKDILNQRGR